MTTQQNEPTFSDKQDAQDTLEQVWGKPCEVRDVDEFDDLKHDERCLNCRFWDAVKRREQALLDDVAAARKTDTTLQPFEVQNYKRLLALEAQGIKDCQTMRAAPKLTPESIVSFINQLSPWNLKTTGISILKAYTDKLDASMDKNKDKS